MAAIDLVGDLVPNVEIDAVLLERDRVVVHLSINEYINSSGVGTWVTNDDYKNLLKIELTETSKRRGALGSTPRSITISSNDHIHSVERITRKNKRKKFQRVAYKIVLKEFNYDNLIKLSYSANTKITKQDLSISRGITFRVVDMKEISGVPSVVPTMENGEALTKSVGYFLGTAFYRGPKVQLENGRWITGTSATDTPEFLTVRTIPNIKVADYRDLYDVLPRISSPFSSLKKEILHCLSGTTLNYFSPLRTCRDLDGNLRFFFTLDYESAYLNTSKYGNLFDRMPPRLRDRVLLSSAIRVMELKRRRVDSAGTTGDICSEPNELFVIGGEETGDNFRESNARYGALREEEFSFQHGDLLLRSFSGADRSFKNINMGKYQYTVQAEVVDGIYKFMDFQSRDLAQSKAQLESYRNTLDENNNYDKSTDTYDPEFIANMKLRTPFENLPYIRALISISENITFLADNLDDPSIKKFINTLRYNLSPRTGTIAGVDKAISILATMQQNMRKVMTVVDRGTGTVWKTKTEAQTAGTPRGKLKFSIGYTFPEVFNAADTYKKGIAFLSSTEVLEIDAAQGLKTISGPDFEKRMQDESIRFFNAEDVSFSVKYGSQSITSQGRGSSFSFLTPTSIRLSDKTYMVNSDDTTSFSGDVQVETLSSGDEEKKYRNVLAELTKPRLQNNFSSFLQIRPANDENFTMVNDQTQLNENNAAKESIEKFEAAFHTRELGYSNPFDTAKISDIILSSGVQKGSRAFEEINRKLENINPMARFTSINSPNLQNTKVPPTTLDKDLSSLSSKIIQSGESLEIIGIDGKSKTISKKNFDLLPNHLKAIFSSGFNFGTAFSAIISSANAGNNDRYNLILGSMAEIEVLTGYDKDIDGDTLISSPNFMPLTRDYYRFSAGKNILCRLKPYEADQIGFKRSNTAQIYNEYFVISVPSYAAAPDDVISRLQIQLNLADNLDQINDIYDSFGIDIDDRFDPRSTRGGGKSPHECAAVADEKTVEDILGGGR